MSISWVFPLAGKGSRIKTLGDFKPFIKINGKEIIQWTLISLSGKIKNKDEIIYITTDLYEKEFGFTAKIGKIHSKLKIENSFKVITTPNTPPGPAASVYKAKGHISMTKPVIVVNGDQYVDFKLPSYIPKKSGYLAVYAEFSQKSSYVQVEEGIITKIVEKDNISNLASAGIYIVSDTASLLAAIENSFDKKIMHKGEYYIGPSLNFLIKKGYTIKPIELFNNN